MNDLKLIGFLIAIVGTAFSISLCSIGIGIYAAALFLSFLTRHESLPACPNSRWLILLFVSLAISLFVSPFFWVSLRGFGKFLEGFLLFYAGADVLRNPRNFRLALIVLLASFAFAALAAVSQDVFGRDFVYFREAIKINELNRVTGSYKHYNDFGSFLVPGIALSAAWFLGSLRRGEKKEGMAVGVVFFLVSYALLRTQSRSALFSTCAAFLFLLFFYRFRWVMLGGLLAGLMVLWYSPTSIGYRLRDLATGSTPERLLLLKTSLRMIQASPFFGLGINTYSDFFPHFRPESYRDIMYAHNSYLQMGTEVGLIGLVLYLGFILLAWKEALMRALSDSALQARAVRLGILAGIVGLLVNAFFESLLQSTQLRTLFWVLMAFAAA